MDDPMDVDELGPIDWIVIEFPGTAAVVARGVRRRTTRRTMRRMR